MIKQKEGRIINLSSVVGYTGNAGQSIYAATKGAITSFTKSIAKELAQFGILANTVAPGFIQTDMTEVLPPEVKEHILATVPLKRLGTAQEVANIVAFLSSDKASYVTGSTFHVNGGMYCT
jgi:3-oxoacyl-[acyl-carrier protein] reductase